MPELHTKGSALRARVHYVEAKGGEAKRAFLDVLTLETREKAQQGFLADQWYPFSMFIELNEAIDRLYGRGDMELCYELGRYGADLNLPTLYKLFFRVGNVGWVLKRAAAAWSVNYDAGSMTVVERHPNGAVLRIDDWPDPRRAHCLSVRGWIVRACELSGETVKKHRETCRVNGDPACQFWVDWG